MESLWLREWKNQKELDEIMKTYKENHNSPRELESLEEVTAIRTTLQGYRGSAS